MKDVGGRGFDVVTYPEANKNPFKLVNIKNKKIKMTKIDIL
jgi:hypothetical protein